MLLVAGNESIGVFCNFFLDFLVLRSAMAIIPYGSGVLGGGLGLMSWACKGYGR